MSDSSDVSDLGTPSSARMEEEAREEAVYRFTPDYDALSNLMEERSISALKEFIETNFVKFTGFNFMTEKVAQILNEYGPQGTKISPKENPTNIITQMRQILEDYKKKGALIDVPIQELGLLQGSVISAKLQSSRKKISEILENASRQVNDSEAMLELQIGENIELQMKVEDLTNQLQNANDRIQQLKGGKFHEDIPAEVEFMRDLKLELSIHENLNSTLSEKLQHVTRTNQQLKQELIDLQEQHVREHHERIRELSDLAKDIELNEGIKKAVIEKIKGLTANKEEIEKAVNDWVKAINEAVGTNQKELRDMSQRIKTMNDVVANRRVRKRVLEDELKKLDTTLPNLEQQVQSKQDTFNQYDQANEDLRRRIRDMEDQYSELRDRVEDDSEIFYSFGSTDVPRSPLSMRSPVSIRTPSFVLPLETIYEESDGSPEQLRMGSPEYSPMHESTSLSFESTPPARRPEFSDRMPSPHDMRSYSPEMQSFRGTIAPGTQTLPGPSSAFEPEMPSFRPTVAPGTQTLPGPSRAFSPEMPSFRRTVAPGTQTLPGPSRAFGPEIVAPMVDPSTQTISGVANRFDIGKSFNLQTVHSGESMPYRQVTRVDSSIPESESDRMIDSPLNVRHTADFTPYVTPFISKSRFGYTDPTARVLNLPPGGEFDVPTGIKKTVVLTSPKRQEALLVNIDVDPKPLTQTTTGEHFICDISLDVQQADKKHLSPVFTYDEPPAVTPTSARKYGMFTPRGIFKKRHYNIRRVHWPNEYQSPNLPWSPQYLPDARSPISGLVPSPQISDSSISWERGPDSPYSSLYRTFDASPGMNRTFTRSPSPAIRGPYYGTQSPAFDRTFDKSPSPEIRSPSYGTQSPVFDRTFDKSPSPAIKGPSYGREWAGIDSASDESPSPVIRGPSHRRGIAERGTRFERSPSPGPSYTQQSPGLDRTFDRRNTSPVISRDSSRSPSPGFDRTFDSHGAFDRTYDSHPTYGRHSPIDTTYESHELSPTDTTYGSSPISRTSDRSSSPKYGSTFGSSGSLYRTGASRFDDTFDRSRGSPRSDASYENDRSAQLNRTFDRSQRSPRSEASYGSDQSGPLNRTFDRSPTNGQPLPHTVYEDAGTADAAATGEDSLLNKGFREAPSFLNRTY